MIQPTIGRKVWFWPVEGHGHMNCIDEQQPFDATVVFVHNDRLVNLIVVDHMGHVERVNKATLKQEEDPVPAGSYAEWMPYQVKQSQK